MAADDRAGQIDCILSDVDGVLTDGRLVFDNHGVETKRFHIRDGLGIKIWKRCGFTFGLLTARSSQIVRVRASELGVDLVRQGAEDKVAVARQILSERGGALENVCYIGDDLTDLPILRQVGLAATVADAADEVCDAADWIAQRRGGHGAVRELIEMILKSKQLWEEAIARYVRP